MWLWDRLPHTLILAVGALLVAAQISSLLWAYAMFTGAHFRLPHVLLQVERSAPPLYFRMVSCFVWVTRIAFAEFLVEKVRLEGMSAAGLEQVKSGFQVALESGQGFAFCCYCLVRVFF